MLCRRGLLQCFHYYRAPHALPDPVPGLLRRCAKVRAGSGIHRPGGGDIAIEGVNGDPGARRKSVANLVITDHSQITRQQIFDQVTIQAHMVVVAVRHKHGAARRGRHKILHHQPLTMSVDELYRMLMSDMTKSQPIKFPVGLNRIAQQVLCMPEPRQRLAKRVGREVSFTSDRRCAGKFESKLARGALRPPN